jgi:hypothetical protein
LKVTTHQIPSILNGLRAAFELDFLGELPRAEFVFNLEQINLIIQCSKSPSMMDQVGSSEALWISPVQQTTYVHLISKRVPAQSLMSAIAWCCRNCCLCLDDSFSVACDGYLFAEVP